MNKRILTYAIGFGFVLAATSAVHAGYSRAVGNQSQSGIAELKAQAANKIEAQQLAEQGKLESLDLSGANAWGSDERLLSAPSISDAAIPVIVYADKAAAYQTAIVAALNLPANQVALVGPGAPLDAIKVIKDAAATQVPKDAPTLALYNAIVAQVATDAATILLSVTVANLTAAATAAKINQLVLEGIVADVAANNAAAPAGSAPNKAAAVCADATSAAAAFGVTYVGGAGVGSWQVTRPLSFTTIKDSAGKDSAGLLHFHQGDFSDTAGFFVGLDETYNYDKLTAQNKEYALSRVDLTPSEWGVVSPMVTPIAPAKVTLNAAADKANPIHGKGLTHLLISGDVDAPSVAVVAKDNPKNLYVVTDIYGGSTVLQNDAVMKDAAAGDTIENVFDIAATRKLTKYFDKGHGADKDRQLLFAAVADKADLNKAAAAKTGIAVMTVEDDKLTPLSAVATDAAGNQAALIDLTDGKLLAKGADATWAKPVAGVNQGDVNLWWDDRYKQLFGTVAGLQPGAAAGNVAFGLFAGNQNADTFKLSAMQPLDADRVDATSELTVAASIFGATTKAANSRVDLYRPRTMHTSTDNNYLLVTGGVATPNNQASKAWINALPLMPPNPANPVKLAKADDLKNELPAFNKLTTPHVDRVAAQEWIVDEYTPYIVGRHPSFLAPVAGSLVTTPVTIEAKDAPKDYQIGAKFGAGSVLTGVLPGKETELNETQFIAVAPNGSVVLTAGTKIAADVLFDKGLIADSNLQFSKATVFGANTKFLADATLTAGDLKVAAADLKLMKDSTLAIGSVIGVGTTLAATAILDAGGASTKFEKGSTLGANSKLAAGSAFTGDDTKGLKVPAGSVVEFNPAVANNIGLDWKTNISLKAIPANGVELHLAQDLAPYTAINSLQKAGTLFAGDAKFVTPNQAALGLDGPLVDSKVALFPLSKADGLSAKAMDGKTCLSNLSKVVTANFAADPVLGRGIVVADAMTQEAITGKDILDVLKAGLDEVLAVPGVPSDVKAVLGAVGVATKTNKGYRLILNAAVDAMTVANATTNEKFTKSVMASAAALAAGAAGTDYEKRALFANAVTAAYFGVPANTLESAWMAAAKDYLLAPGASTPIGYAAPGSEATLTDQVLAGFKNAMTAAAIIPGDMNAKLAAIYDQGLGYGDGSFGHVSGKTPKVGLDAKSYNAGYLIGKANYNTAFAAQALPAALYVGPKNRASLLKLMTAEAVTQFPADSLMKEFDKVAQLNDKSCIEMAVAAVQEYCSPTGGVAPAVDTAKYITRAMADDKFIAANDGASAFATGIAKGLESLIAPASYNDGGAQVLNAAVTKALGDKATGAFTNETIPLAAVTELAKKTPVLVPGDAGAMAGRSIIKFALADDLTLVKYSMIGANSVLTGLMPQQPWTMNSGLKLADGTYLPAFTLFKKAADVSYASAQLAMATGSNAAADAGTPWGGQWTLANVQDDRAATKQTGVALTLNKAVDGIKIVTDRVIKANVVGDAWNQYSVTVPVDTILPAGTKFETTGILDLSATFKTVNGGAWDGPSADLNLGAGKSAVVAQAVKATAAYNMPDGLIITFPEYPTAMIQDFTLPAGARIKNTSAVALDVHDKIVKAAVGGGAFLKADGVTNALALAANESFVLPEAAKIIATGAHTYYTFPAGLTIENDPLYTAGIISGSVSPASTIANAYKLPVDMKLKKDYEQTFWPGTTFKQNVEIKPQPATGLTVVNEAPAVGPQPSEALKTAAGDFSITNVGGNVTAIDALIIAAATAVKTVTVGANPLVLGINLVVADVAGVQVTKASELHAGTVFGTAVGPVNITLGAALPFANGDQIVKDGTVIKQGSTIKTDTKIAVGGTLTVEAADLQLNAVAGGDVLELHNTPVVGMATGALRGADSTLTIPMGNDALVVSAGKQWKLAATDKITVGANTTVELMAAGKLGTNSIIAAGSTVVTAQSPYAVSATDMQVVGDTVYIGLEGDRNPANGIEAGVFKSTALFNDKGLVRGWTPWQRTGANTDATAFFGHSESTGNLVYLTSPEGKAFLDASTDSLINPATTVKLTQWGSGDDVLHSGASLPTALGKWFTTSDNPQPGVYGLFDFDPDTRSFKTVFRRYQDPVFSMMIATGYERVSLIQTGATDAKTKTFMPTKKFDKTTVFNFGADKGLKGLGTITCAEITRNAPVALGAVAVDNWIFVGGTNGLAVLVDPAGEGFKSDLKALDATTFPKLGHKFIELKNGADPITNVRRIVADEATGYVYVVTKDKVLRIKPSAAVFTGPNKGVLVEGAFGALGTICPLADVPNSIYIAGGPGDLLKAKALGGGDAEFTDLVILKSSTAATKPATLLLATTAGLVKSDDKTIVDTFPGDAAALKTANLWTPFNCKYNAGDIPINARDNADATKKAATVGAALRIIPANLHSGGRMMVTGNDHTFEGNLQVLATNSDGSALRQYRLNASKGAVTTVAEATNKDAAALLPYFAKLGDMDPGTLKNLDDNVFVLAMNSETFASGLPALISAAMVDEAIIAAAVAESELNLGGEYADMLVLPQMMTVSDSASGAVYAPANSGVVVNE